MSHKGFPLGWGGAKSAIMSNWRYRGWRVTPFLAMWLTRSGLLSCHLPCLARQVSSAFESFLTEVLQHVIEVAFDVAKVGSRSSLSPVAYSRMRGCE
jgi:hypothetical protein